MEFFSNIVNKGKLLDAGCGQGRNAVRLSILGYSVTALDVCDLGLRYVKEDAKINNVNIEVIREDMYKFKRYKEYDFVLMDSILHFYKNDKDRETLFLKRVIKEMNPGSYFCNCMLKQKQKENYLKRIIQESEYIWENIMETYEYNDKTKAEMHIYIVRKTEKLQHRGIK